MAILTTFIKTVVEMIMIAAVAVGGIRVGKLLRDRKDAKTKTEV